MEKSRLQQQFRNKELSIKSRKIRYEGDSYKNDWKEEAQKRGIVKVNHT